MFTSKVSLLFSVSMVVSLLSAVVTLSNYLIANSMINTNFKEAVIINPYIKYWAILTIFFIVVSIIMLCIALLFRSKNQTEAHYDFSESVKGYGTGPVEEYVTVRVKKDELSKLRG